MWNQFVNSVITFWHNLELVYGYRPVLEAKESLNSLFILIIGLIVMYFFMSWVLLQLQRSDVVEGMSAMRGSDGKTLTNPKNQADLLDSIVGLIYLKFVSHTNIRPKYPERARMLVRLLVILLVIFFILGIISVAIPTLPYGNVHP